VWTRRLWRWVRGGVGEKGREGVGKKGDGEERVWLRGRGWCVEHM
jgi:hypothetical protein